MSWPHSELMSQTGAKPESLVKIMKGLFIGYVIVLALDKNYRTALKMFPLHCPILSCICIFLGQLVIMDNPSFREGSLNVPLVFFPHG